MKKVLSLLLTVAMLLSMMSITAFATEITETVDFTEITSDTTELTAGTTYKIATADGLIKFGALVNALAANLNCTVYLANDIDMSGKTWATMGGTSGSACKFIGTFDGNGFAISNLTISDCTNAASGYEGFINRAESGTKIKNLGLINCTVSGSGRFVGGLVGRLRPGASVENCYFKGSLTAAHTKNEGYPGCGGLVGTVDGGSVTNCYGIISSNTATDYSYGGTGVVGCLNSGTVSAVYANMASTSSSLTAFVNVYADAATAAGNAPSDLNENFAYDTNSINGGWPILAWQDPAAVKFGAAPKVPGIQYTVQSGTNQVYISGIHDVSYWIDAPETLVIPKKVTTSSENAFIVDGVEGTEYDVTGVTGAMILASLPTKVKTLVIDADLQTLPVTSFRETPVETLIITGNLDLGATEDGDKAQIFRNCTKMKNLQIFGNVGLIGYRSFYYCTSLKNVVLGDGVTALGDYAFYGAESIESIYIPKTVTSIGAKAFMKYSSGSAMTLNTVNFEDTEAAITANANIVPDAFEVNNATGIENGLTITYGQAAPGLIRSAGYQTRENQSDSGKYDVRFAGIIGMTDYEKVGFDIVVKDATTAVVKATKKDGISTTVVYSALSAMVDGTTETVTAEDQGGNYIYAVTVEGIPAGTEYTFEITPFAIVNGVKVSGEKQTVNLSNAI